MGFEVYDENNNEITENFTLTDNDFIDYVVPSGGTYYIRIFGDRSGNVYNLLWFSEESNDFTIIVLKMKRSKIKNK